MLAQCYVKHSVCARLGEYRIIESLVGGREFGSVRRVSVDALSAMKLFHHCFHYGNFFSPRSLDPSSWHKRAAQFFEA